MMDEEDLRRVEAEVRAAVVESDMRWVLDDVDAAIAAGVAEERVLRRRRGRAAAAARPAGVGLAAQYEAVPRVAVDVSEYEASRKHGQLVITTRPMTSLERVEVLLSAVRRVLVELPEIEAECLNVLAAAPDSDAGTRIGVQGVTFEPDEGAAPGAQETLQLASRLPQDSRDSLDALFAEATAEVRA